MPTSTPRPPVTREALATLLASAGLVLGPDELDGLLAPVAAIYTAIDGLDSLDLAGAEPAPVYFLPTSEPAPAAPTAAPGTRP